MTRHLSTLSVLHFVYGAFLCVSGLAAVLIIGLGTLLGSDLITDTGGEPMPDVIVAFIQGFGLMILIIVELWGVLNLLSGYWIGRRTNRTASMIIGALNCLSVPIGLALGIFTLITLSSKEVEDAYAYRI
ncbi:MAG: hypothetical protein JNL52_01270 [Flavobacteriales bacterium]|nr:hypothetical protein [Flavobacteriales bacterium]